MALPKPTRPVHLVLDYDGTLTVKDTMAVLGDLPKQPKMSWQEIVNLYMADYAQYKDDSHPWKNYDRVEYSAWLAARKWVEEKSAARVQDADFFKGVTFDEVERSVEKHLSTGTLQLRNGWDELFRLVMNSPGSQISILSVNWSSTSIRLALLHAARRLKISEQEQGALIQLIETMEIAANEIEGLRLQGGASGKLCTINDIRTSDDKLRRLPPKAHGNPLLIYAGDSSTDFDSLCAADLGLWVYDVPESELRESFAKTFAPFDRSGFFPTPLSSVQCLEESTDLFYWTPGFEQLIALLTAL